MSHAHAAPESHGPGGQTPEPPARGSRIVSIFWWRGLMHMAHIHFWVSATGAHQGRIAGWRDGPDRTPG